MASHSPSSILHHANHCTRIYGYVILTPLACQVFTTPTSKFSGGFMVRVWQHQGIRNIMPQAAAINRSSLTKSICRCCEQGDTMRT